MDVKVLYLGLDSFHVVCAGSNTPGGRPEITRATAELVQIGSDGLGDEAARSNVWGRALGAIRRLVALSDFVALDASSLTMASGRLREIGDNDGFFEAVRREHALRPKFLSDEAETCLTYLGAHGNVEASSRQTVVVDVGTRSIRFAVGSDSSCLATARAPLGVSQLRAAFGRLQPGDEQALAAVLRLSAGPAVAVMRRSCPERVIFSSSLARGVRHVARAWGFMGLDETSLCRLALHALLPQLLKTPARALCRLGLNQSLASHLAISAVVLDALADLFQVAEVTLADRGLPEGIALCRLGPTACRCQPVLDARSPWTFCA